MDLTNTTADVCERCHGATQNDDWTWIDFYCTTPEESEEEYNRITAMVDYLDPSEPASEHETNGYWECWVCDEVVLSTAFRYVLRGVD